MIDPVKVKQFWLARGQKEQTAFESLANLEEDPELLALKIRLEQEQVMPRLRLCKEMDVLDLGAGNGQWTFRFAPQVRSVTAVEFSPSLVEKGRAEAVRRGMSNVTFIESAAEDFTPDRAFPLVFISGLFVYLDDQQAPKVAAMAARALTPGGMLFLRDGTSILGTRHIIDNRWSALLKTDYSAVYRTPEEYTKIFTAEGLTLQEHHNMFEEGCPLNKYPETRLRFYVFTRPQTGM